jgi:tetratricopeptide (TPR) repeat protein
MSVTRISCVVIVLLAGAVGPRLRAAADDETLQRAKGLYATAAYDEALAVLDQLQKGSAAPAPDSAAIAEYRVFCLLALDRLDEARKNIEGILHSNPRYLPSDDQASPRIQNVFRDVRRQTLPKIVMERYAVAKAAFERKDTAAAQQFDDVLALLEDPDLDQASALKDLRTVASAFRDLANALATSTPKPVDGSTAQTAAIAKPQVADIIYTMADTDVTPPIAQSQRIPPWRPASPIAAMQEFKGTLRLLIDQAGVVVSAAMPSSTGLAYDQQLLRAARDWRFVPAQKQGQPVRYLKVIEFHLKPTAP